MPYFKSKNSSTGKVSKLETRDIQPLSLKPWRKINKETFRLSKCITNLIRTINRKNRSNSVSTMLLSDDPSHANFQSFKQMNWVVPSNLNHPRSYIFERVNFYVNTLQFDSSFSKLQRLSRKGVRSSSFVNLRINYEYFDSTPTFDCLQRDAIINLLRLYLDGTMKLIQYYRVKGHSSDEFHVICLFSIHPLMDQSSLKNRKGSLAILNSIFKAHHLRNTHSQDGLEGKLFLFNFFEFENVYDVLNMRSCRAFGRNKNSRKKFY